ncbi:HLA class II histocompatibility antigen, DO beta chain isoform X2 [Suricata suricatta]|uniref:HLA class II histocompatibility antigen, DO beta chain isoform X2 n=1 Tax=Suricata suricatta TaxID=37032 RepID=UPI001155F0FA|nr:HLA class II histocompatibility antigen, DO beta chain isoform X2 [Suricata suricatta]
MGVSPILKKLMTLLSHLFFSLRMGSEWVSWMMALLVSVIRLDSSMTQGRDSPEDFVIQAKADCYFTNGTEKVQFVVRFIFNLEEYAHFDSDVGMFVALTELVQPEVTVYPERTPSLQHHNMLLCSVTGFYPGDIKIRWFRNGKQERVGVMSTGLIRNGDWTFQTMVMLEMTPELGDVYTCLVNHPSLQSPISVEWRAQSAYSWRKMLSGIAAFLLGLIFLLVGTVICLRAQKGYVETQLSGDEVSRAVPSP